MAEGSLIQLASPGRWLGWFRNYYGEVRNEMRRVSWPGRQEVYGTTVVVIITVFLFGLYFFIVDSAFSYVVNKVIDFLLHRS